MCQNIAICTGFFELKSLIFFNLTKHFVYESYFHPKIFLFVSYGCLFKFKMCQTLLYHIVVHVVLYSCFYVHVYSNNTLFVLLQKGSFLLSYRGWWNIWSICEISWKRFYGKTLLQHTFSCWKQSSAFTEDEIRYSM